MVLLSISRYWKLLLVFGPALSSLSSPLLRVRATTCCRCLEFSFFQIVRQRMFFLILSVLGSTVVWALRVWGRVLDPSC